MKNYELVKEETTRVKFEELELPLDPSISTIKEYEPYTNIVYKDLFRVKAIGIELPLDIKVYANKNYVLVRKFNERYLYGFETLMTLCKNKEEIMIHHGDYAYYGPLDGFIETIEDPEEDLEIAERFAIDIANELLRG